MKKFLLVLLTVVSALTMANAQSTESQQKIPSRLFYSELGGPGVLFSANYDGRFNNTSNRGFGYRLGLGFSTYEETTYGPIGGPNSYATTNTKSYITIPFGLNFVMGKEGSPNMFEVGAGLTVLTKKVNLYSYGNDQDQGNIIGAFSFMYRRQPVDGGFSWRIGFTPIIGTAGDIVPSAAVGLGYCF